MLCLHFTKSQLAAIVDKCEVYRLVYEVLFKSTSQSSYKTGMATLECHMPVTTREGKAMLPYMLFNFCHPQPKVSLSTIANLHWFTGVQVIFTEGREVLTAIMFSSERSIPSHFHLYCTYLPLDIKHSILSKGLVIVMCSHTKWKSGYLLSS